jgi:trans-aconitate methyltransferase
MEIEALTLDELGLKHGTDKASHAHNYLVHYEQLLQPYRTKPDLSVLEIGVRDGASVRLWHDYFPDAKIVGVDITEACQSHANDRIAIEIGDQSDPDFLERLMSNHRADIIFDDGSHQWSHQIDSFRFLFPHLQPGGLFVCEDLHTSRSKWVDKYGRRYTHAAADYFGRLAAMVGAEGDVYGSMSDAPMNIIQKQIEWVKFGRGWVAVKKF